LEIGGYVSLGVTGIVMLVLFLLARRLDSKEE